MSDRTVTITLTAKDGMSKTFQAAGKAGESMAQTLKRAADQAEAELKQLGKTSQQTGRDLTKLKSDATQLGLGIGVLAGAMGLSGKMFRDQEVALRTLERGYGNAADGLRDFAEQIQDTTNFSNDAAVATANIFRTLADNYNFTAEQIQQLITISADLAATTGIDLADAATRVQSAMRGEAEAAEYLGLTLNDRALGLDRVSTSMSDAEKAQIRFNALQEQSAFAMGAANEQAQTTYGTMTDLRDSLQDAMQSVGDFLGPFGEIGAFAADNAVQVAALSLGLGQLGRAALAANSMIGAGGLAGSLARLAPLLGPVGGIALGATAVAISLATAGEAGEDNIGTWEAYRKVLEGLGRTVDGFAADISIGDDLVALSDDVEQSLRKIQFRYDEFAGLEEKVIGGSANAAELEAYNALVERFGGNVAVAGAMSARAVVGIEAVLTAFGPGAETARASLAALDEQLDNNTITIPEYFREVINLAEGLDELDRAARDADEAMRLGVRAGNTWIDLAQAGKAETAEWSKEFRENLVEALEKRLVGAFDAVRTAYTATTDALSSGFQTVVGNTNAIASQSQAVADWAEELIAAEGVYSKLDDLVAAGRITGESGVFTGTSEYAQAQQAYNDIVADNAEIQEHILTIQAKQAPAQAQMLANLEQQYAAIAAMNPEQQELALGMMDAATSAQALGLAQAYIADQDAFGPMLLQAANLNPYLGEILEQMGLVKEVSEDTYELNFDGEEAKSEIALLTDAIEGLTEELWMVRLGIEDNASGTLAYVQGLLNDINNQVATATVSVNYIPGTSFTGLAHGGLLDFLHAPAAQHGRYVATPTWVGENGPELLAGNMVIPHTASMRGRESSMGGGLAVNIYGNVYGMDDLTEQVTRELVPAIQRATSIHRQGYAA